MSPSHVSDFSSLATDQKFPPESDSSLVLGLDIGGTKTHAALAPLSDPAGVVQEVKSASANVQNVSREQAEQALEETARSFDAWDDTWRERLSSVVVGAGGADTDADRLALSGLVRESLELEEEQEILVVHDTRLILETAEKKTGIGVILGTGSVAWGLSEEGLEARAGGWGYLLGDEASAYWFGREAVRACLSAMEETRGMPGQDDPLVSLTVTKAQVAGPADLIARFYAKPERGYWASFAPLVFQAQKEGSARAQEIIERAVVDAVKMISQVADALASDGPVVLGGGLVQNQPGFQDLLKEELAGEGLMEVLVLKRDPVIGALLLARDVVSSASRS